MPELIDFKKRNEVIPKLYDSIGAEMSSVVYFTADVFFFLPSRPRCCRLPFPLFHSLPQDGRHTALQRHHEFEAGAETDRGRAR